MELILPLGFTLLAVIAVLFLIWLIFKAWHKPNLPSDQHSFELIHQANQQAQDLLINAELTDLKAEGQHNLSTQKVNNQLEEDFHVALDRIETNFNDQAIAAQKQFVAYLADLQTRTTQSQSQIEAASKARIDQLFERFEQNLTAFLTQTQSHSTEAINLEIKGARQLIDAYKAQQLALIDENIVAMLEKTLSLVVSKKLSLKDHMDLVFESLEKAKAEKFIA